jgi:hypothetical protein
VSNDPEEIDAIGAARSYQALGTGANVDVGITGMDEMTKDMSSFTTTLNTLTASLKTLSTSAASIGSNISGMFKSIGSSMSGTMTNVGDVTSSMFGTAGSKGWAQDLLMFPTRYMRSAITDNRQLALQASAGLGPQAFASGASTQRMMAALAGNFGNVLSGSPDQLVNMMQIAGQVGAGIDWRYYANAVGGNVSPYPNASGPRAPGFLQSMYQAQRINPGADLGSLAKDIGGQLANVGGNQQAAYLTGGAFSMIGPGNTQKSISEWATGILKWLQNLRPGADRGKEFTYGDLMAQNFPGSNIDAWLTAAGVTDAMKQYFWSYALAQAGTGHGTADELFSKNAAVSSSVAFNRLQAVSAQTQTGFQLAGQMAGAYANKEQANQWFAQLTGSMMNQVLPAAMSSGALSYMQYLPDTIEEILMQLAERTTVGSLGAGIAGWGGLLGLGNQANQGPNQPNGDVGDYGSLGTSGTAGLHPDMRKRVEAMMQANPNLRVTSGHRDLAKQQALRRKGVGRVSGGPSAHTRGMAADLGPRSQYSWIVSNAGRFGLKSGMFAGEPWHVGMGDVVDVGQTDSTLSSALGQFQNLQGGQEAISQSLGGVWGGLLSALFGGANAGLSAGASIFGAATPEQEIQGVGSGVSGLMKLIMGVFGGNKVDPNALAYRDVYSQLIAATNKAPGLPPTVTPQNGLWGNLINQIKSGTTSAAAGANGAAVAAGAAGAGADGSMTLNSFFSQVLGGLGVPVTANNLAKLGAVARQEGNKGGSFNPFNSTGGDFPAFNYINGRPGVKNYPDSSTGVGYTVQLLSQKNTSSMRANLNADGSFADWISATNAFYHSWGGGNINMSQSQGAAELTHIINAGDVEGLPTTAMSGATTLQFNNTFVIQGGGGSTNGPSQGIDVNRTVTMIADKLEQEMQRRVARSN